MDALTLTIILFVTMALFLFVGVPISFCLGGVGILVALWQIGPSFLYGLASTTFRGWSDFLLIACPLFILMGNLLEASKIAEDLYDMMYKWLGGLRGGLATGTIIICAVFAAMAGVSGVATITMGLIALPSMLDRNYDKYLAVGVISAGGTLGILIPPSIIMIIYGSITGVSIGKLFMGGVLPGIMISVIFILYVQIRAYAQKDFGPPLPKEERVTFKEKIHATTGLIYPGILVAVVLGVIYTGVCTATEASAIGAFGALICTVLQRRFTWGIFWESLCRTFRINAMLMWIVLGAKCFTHTYHAIGSPALMLDIVSSVGLNPWVIQIVMQLILFVLGCFLDPIGILLICTPVFLPILEANNVNLLWFGILFTINMELAYITPPFGFNLFYMRSIAPKGISMADIYYSIVPFVFLLALGLALVMIFPQIALWLPDTMIK